MTNNNEIIIDGLNVAKCPYYKNGKCKIPHYCNNIKYTSCNCYEWNCDYKLSQILDKENTELKQKNEELEKKLEKAILKQLENANKYKQALADIKEIAESLSDDCSNYEENEDCTKCVGNMLCISYIKDLILAKINEVKDER